MIQVQIPLLILITTDFFLHSKDGIYMYIYIRTFNFSCQCKYLDISFFLNLSLISKGGCTIKQIKLGTITCVYEFLFTDLCRFLKKWWSWGFDHKSFEKDRHNFSIFAIALIVRTSWFSSRTNREKKDFTNSGCGPVFHRKLTFL